LDRSSENRAGRNEQPEQGVPSQARTQVLKERETKEDGRYIIFYTFEDDGEDAAS
jgi:hypothetical protein